MTTNGQNEQGAAEITNFSVENLGHPESVMKLRKELTNEIEILQLKVIQSLENNDLKNRSVGVGMGEENETKEVEKLEEKNRTLIKMMESVKERAEDQRNTITAIKDNLDKQKQELEARVKELESENAALADEVRCKDVSISLLHENIVFARQNNETANNIIDIERKEVEELKKQVDKLKLESEIKDMEIRALSKQVEIEKLTKEVGMLSSQIKRKHAGEENDSNKKQKKSKGQEKYGMPSKGSKEFVPTDEERSYNSDVVSIFDPEEEVEEGVEFLESMKGEIDCIFSCRELNNNEDEEEYYVKWKNKSYAEATWEAASFIKKQHGAALVKFRQKQNYQYYPKNYNDAVQYDTNFTALKEQPNYIGSETLRLKPFQIDGLNFILNAWHNGQSAILADQEGMGKTIQAIAFLKYLFHNFNFKGPMLVCVPTRTLATWFMEFEKWAPDMVLVCYAGDSKSRKVIRSHVCENSDGDLIFNVLLTDYSLVCKDFRFFQDIVWSNIVLDESDRLKSKDSKLFKVMMGMECHHRLLLTPVPPQNSLEELWCVLNFLKLKDVNIGDWEEFMAKFGSHNRTGVGKLQALIKSIIIRRRLIDLQETLPWLQQ